jgi:hypothetical protein
MVSGCRSYAIGYYIECFGHEKLYRAHLTIISHCHINKNGDLVSHSVKCASLSSLSKI